MKSCVDIVFNHSVFTFQSLFCKVSTNSIHSMVFFPSIFWCCFLQVWMCASGDFLPKRSRWQTGQDQEEGLAQSARFQPIISDERQKEDMEAEEAACNENPHVFMPRRDHPFEGMSHPIPQVTLRCNCDVKYLGRGIDQEDFENLIKAHSADIRSVVRRVVVDMTRDMMDVQFYTGEYASKKFEVARDMLPELHQGLDRLKKQLEEEKEAAEAETAAVAVDEVAPGSKRPLRPGGVDFFFVSALCF